MLNLHEQNQSAGCGSGGQAMQVVSMRLSIVSAKPQYSTSPIDLQSQSGSPFRLRADCTRQLFIIA